MWENWGSCTQECSNDNPTRCGIQIRTASCYPAHAICEGVSVEQKTCGCGSCPISEANLPVGSIIPWVRKPNSGAHGSRSPKQFKKWILCDGRQRCDRGDFRNQVCTNLKGRALIGADYIDQDPRTYSATLPNHHHPHGHETTDHFHSVNSHSHSYSQSHYSIDYWHRSYDSSPIFGGSRAIYSLDLKTDKTSNKDTSYEYLTTRSRNVNVKETYKTNVGSIDGASEGPLYPKHVRVQFLFKCY